MAVQQVAHRVDVGNARNEVEHTGGQCDVRCFAPLEHISGGADDGREKCAAEEDEARVQPVFQHDLFQPVTGKGACQHCQHGRKVPAEQPAERHVCQRSQQPYHPFVGRTGAGDFPVCAAGFLEIRLIVGYGPAEFAQLRVDVEAAKAWMAKGAEPTERVQKLFALVGLCDKPAVRETPKKSAPKAKAQERMKEAAEKAEAARLAAEEAKAAEEAAKAEAQAAAEAPAEETAPTETAAE